MTAKPQIISHLTEVQTLCTRARRAGQRVSLVPTMGALHPGHLSLVAEARKRSDFVVVSIFVNPTQFGAGEDFDRYPRTLESDLEKLAPLDVSLVFAPDAADMYQRGFATKVSVTGLTDRLCGANRPGHFDGVTTVVSKLFHIVGPCTAVFGRKDYQQLAVITRMVGDLNLPVTVVGRPTFREPDGLAMSSRNVYLDKEERARALSLVHSLKEAHRLFAAGERQVGAVRGAVQGIVSQTTDSIDYVAAAHPDTLETLPDEEFFTDRLLIALAVKIGRTRLIDNTVLGEDILR